MTTKILVTKDAIHVSVAGTYKVIRINDKHYGEVRQLVKEGREDEIPDIFNRAEVKIEEYIEGSGLTMVNGTLQDAQGNKLPQVLSERLVDLKEDGMPVTALVNFWENLKQNPSMNSREQLYKFLEQNGHPLTEDGHFIAYRGVRTDFKDRHSGTFDNSPGSVCEVPRENVDDNPNRTCSAGLHVAAFEYANGFAPITVEVKVNPRDVVAVPTDYNGQKMRVCRFEVIQVCEREITDTSVYGQGYTHTDWDADEPDYNEDDIESVVLAAQEHVTRYKDRASLAARIEEDVDWLELSEILEILNDTEDQWN